MSVFSAYRRDIDGLRGLAVLAVIFYHLKFPWVAGGFLGVDIFFVLSGYLISTLIILPAVQGKAFSLVHFFVRRIRRIVPALLVVCIITYLMAYILLLPSELIHFYPSVTPSLFFYSNYYFLSVTQDYFEAQEKIIPLLHSWSLGIEVQFYIYFAVALLLILKTKRIHPKYIVYAGVIGSLIISTLMGWSLLPEGAFFLIKNRLWEFLIGAAVVFRKAWPEYFSKIHNECIALVCLLIIAMYMVAGSALALNYAGTTSMVGITILPLCIATALLIWMGKEGIKTYTIHRVLCSRPLVFFGLISYSMYLFHWPILQYYQYITYQAPRGFALIIFSVSCTALSYASWRYIETPFRDSFAISSRNLVIILAVGYVSFGCMRYISIMPFTELEQYTQRMRHEGTVSYREKKMFLDADSII